MKEIALFLEKIDEVNAKDPNLELVDGKQVAKELIYGQRMTELLMNYVENPSAELQIAARGQHIERWYIPRSDYPMDRKGYLKWRTMLKIHHGKLLAEMMEHDGYSQESIDKVVDLVNKKKLKTDLDSKLLEDVICLVFMKFYLEDFAAKHEDDKLINIIQKTWSKMTEKGHEEALKLRYSERNLNLIKAALA